jgi:DNA-binding response OmpR family regulator
MASILLISPDRSLQAFVPEVLAGSGHTLTTADSPDTATVARSRVLIDLVLVDTLTGSLQEIRDAFAAPFVFIAAGTGILPGRLPLREGDHVVAKPVAAADLRAAIAQTLRAPADHTGTITFSGVTLDRERQLLRSESGAIQLTPLEFHLIDYLARANGTVMSSEDLLQNVWRYAPGTGSSDVIRSHLKNLRAKLREIAISPDLIETVPRRGYRLSAG